MYQNIDNSEDKDWSLGRENKPKSISSLGKILGIKLGISLGVIAIVASLMENDSDKNKFTPLSDSEISKRMDSLRVNHPFEAAVIFHDIEKVRKFAALVQEFPMPNIQKEDLKNLSALSAIYPRLNSKQIRNLKNFIDGYKDSNSELIFLLKSSYLHLAEGKTADLIISNLHKMGHTQGSDNKDNNSNGYIDHYNAPILNNDGIPMVFRDSESHALNYAFLPETTKNINFRKYADPIAFTLENYQNLNSDGKNKVRVNVFNRPDVFVQPELDFIHNDYSKAKREYIESSRK